MTLSQCSIWINNGSDVMKKTLHALDLSAEYAKHYSPLIPANDILNVALSAALLLTSKFSVTLSVNDKELEYNDICWTPTSVACRCG